jgi:catechol 2,3-dioxygenase-like lactoylglutathione lyase family enzyme
MIASLDHFVLTVRDLEATVKFYTGLGMEFRELSHGRRALHFGRQKINVHILGKEFEPKASLAMPGTADLCFLVDCDIEAVATKLAALGIPPLLGPVKREGAQGMMLSIYCRDPDGNLVELSQPIVA